MAPDAGPRATTPKQLFPLTCRNSGFSKQPGGKTSQETCSIILMARKYKICRACTTRFLLWTGFHTAIESWMEQLSSLTFYDAFAGRVFKTKEKLWDHETWAKWRKTADDIFSGISIDRANWDHSTVPIEILCNADQLSRLPNIWETFKLSTASKKTNPFYWAVKKFESGLKWPQKWCICLWGEEKNLGSWRKFW